MSYGTSSLATSQGAPSNQANAGELASTRHRKSGSTVGGRPWSNEEEAYLIEARQHNMPYKHIAEHLKKTELACRLHFHQNSFGTKRRRRAASITSVGSIDEYPDQPARQHGHQMLQRRLPSFSPAPICPPYRSRSADTFRGSPSNSHTPVAPKPRCTSSQDGLPINALRLFTDRLGFPKKGQAIDNARLIRIYKANRVHFWSLIASEYGHNASPAALEEAWRTLCASPHAACPPTPSESPRSSADTLPVLDSPLSALTESTDYSGFSPLNARQGTASAVSSGMGRSSFAVSSLLTDDKEVTGYFEQDKGTEAARSY
ncbi:hypothetical protein LPUS_00399 [Lasallia pustulata]|uniref:Myb-like domain-containing protein n=1 Tax=Lasallia pustulata TaxID=136370 RepID=A0A1W5CXB5_9LECA|nr:hypothetical protein LPUS_00399 [Lasallia pustulata]